MNNDVILYQLINYIKTKNSHGKNELIDKIIELQTNYVLRIFDIRKENELYLENLKKGCR